MTRVMVLWSRPHHLAPEDDEGWTRAQVHALVKTAGVRNATLTRLGDASRRHPRSWDWLLELELATPVHGELDAWVGDLRLLGSRPAIALAAGTVPLEGC